MVVVTQRSLVLWFDGWNGNCESSSWVLTICRHRYRYLYYPIILVLQYTMSLQKYPYQPSWLGGSAHVFELLGLGFVSRSEFIFLTTNLFLDGLAFTFPSFPLHFWDDETLAVTIPSIRALKKRKKKRSFLI